MENLILAVDQQIATITLNVPPENALSSRLLGELSECMDQIEGSSYVRATILCGKGPFFSAGADIKEFASLTSESDYTDLAEKGQQLMERIESFPKPIIAAIHGAALGSGLELAMACHIRIAESGAKLGLTELELGIIPGFAGTQRLPQYVGTAKALEMIGTAQPISGTEAFTCGLVTKLANNREEVFEKAHELALQFAEKSPKTLEYVLELLHANKIYTYEGAMKLEVKRFGEIFQTKDSQEGIQAYLEKRKPKFTGE